MFHIGQKVVCIDNSPAWNGELCSLLKGGVYTVRSLRDGPDGIGVLLREVDPGIGWYGWNPARFRPVAERKTETGMAILREILDRESHQDRAPVKDKQKQSQ